MRSQENIKDCRSLKRRKRSRKQKKKQQIGLTLTKFDSPECFSTDTGICQESSLSHRKRNENIFPGVQKSPKSEKFKAISSKQIENLKSLSSFPSKKKEINAVTNQPQITKGEHSYEKIFEKVEEAQPTIQDNYINRTSVINKRIIEKNTHIPFENYEISNNYCPGRTEKIDFHTFHDTIFNSSDNPILQRSSIRLSQSHLESKLDVKSKFKINTQNGNRLQSEVFKKNEICRSFTSNSEQIKMQCCQKNTAKTILSCKQSNQSWAEDNRCISRSPIQECFNIIETQSEKMVASMESTIGSSDRSYLQNSPLNDKYYYKNKNIGNIFNNKQSDSTYCSRRDLVESIFFHESKITSNNQGTLLPFIGISSKNSVSSSEKNILKNKPVVAIPSGANEMSSNDNKSKQIISNTSLSTLCPLLRKESRKPKLSKKEAPITLHEKLVLEKDSMKNVSLKTSVSLNGLLHISNKIHSPNTSFLRAVNSINAMPSSNSTSQSPKTICSSSGDKNLCCYEQGEESESKCNTIHKYKSKPKYDGQHSKKYIYPLVHHSEDERDDDENNSDTLEHFIDDEKNDIVCKDFDKDFEMLKNLKVGIAAKARKKMNCIEKTTNDKISLFNTNVNRNLEKAEIENTERRITKDISVCKTMGKNIYSTSINSSIKNQANLNEMKMKTTEAKPIPGLSLVHTTNERFSNVNNSLLLVNSFSPLYENLSSQTHGANYLQKPKIAIKPFKISESQLGVQATLFPLKETNLVDNISATLVNSSSVTAMAASESTENLSTLNRIRPKKISDFTSSSRASSSTKNSISSRSRSQSTTSSSSSRTSYLNGSSSYTSDAHTRPRSYSGARSPSIPRRRGSPSFLDRRRITSARKRPIPYHRPTSTSLSSESSSYESRCSSLRSSHSKCKSRSPSGAF